MSGMHNNRMSGLPKFNELASSAHEKKTKVANLEQTKPVNPNRMSHSVKTGKSLSMKKNRMSSNVTSDDS